MVVVLSILQILQLALSDVNRAVSVSQGPVKIKRLAKSSGMRGGTASGVTDDCSIRHPERAFTSTISLRPHDFDRALERERGARRRDPHWSGSGASGRAVVAARPVR